MGPFLYPRRWDSGICGTPHLNQQEVKFEAFSTTKLKAQVAWMVFHSRLLDEKIEDCSAKQWSLFIAGVQYGSTT